jgi:predicted RNA-binding Zn ribbon-like protein
MEIDTHLTDEHGHGAHGSHGHQASLDTGLDFCNTLEFSRGVPEEHLPTVDVALQWLMDHDLLHRAARQAEASRFAEDPAAGERSLARIRKVRAAMRELVDATVEGRPPDLAHLREVNRALRTHYIYELVPAPDGVSLDHRHEGDPIEGALARLAESVGREVSQGEPDRLRVCANEDCRWVFSDSSRTGRRKWCDMSTCGNRAKAARHRERKRQETDLADAVASPDEGGATSLQA